MVARSFSRIFAVLCVMGCLTCCSGAFAQAITGTINGSVHDASGAAITGAAVKIQDTVHNVQARAVQTDANGNYTAPQLQPGMYAITATAQGFKSASVLDVHLNVGDTLAINLTLPVGSSTETVTVSASDVQVNTQSASESTLINGAQMVGLPLNNRNYEQMVGLQPGVAYGGGDQLYIGLSNPSGETNVVAFSINGQRSSANTWTVDGADNVDRGSNYTLLIYPSIDAISEFRTIRNTYSAEFGRSASGQINLITKSGTNLLHGDLHEFNRGDYDAANTYSNKLSGLARPPLHYNNYGYTIGGPVWLGKLYDGRNKTFFFFSQEFRRVITYSSLTLAGDPTAAMRSGTFPVPVCVAVDANGKCTQTSTQINNIDPTAQAYIKDVFSKIPAGNIPDSSTNANITLNTIERNLYNETQEIGRLDQNFGNKFSVFFRVVDDSIPTVEPGGLFQGAGFPGVGVTSTNAPGRNYLGHFLYTFSPKFLVDGGFAYSYGAILSDPIGYLDSNQSPDVKPTLPYVSTLGRVPSLTFTGGTALGSYGPYRDYNRDRNPYANLTYILGKHSLRAGASYHYYQKSENAAGSNAGSFGFTNTGAPSGTGSYYQSWAWFLLGQQASFSQASLDLTPDIRMRQFEAYLQDDWKVTPRLTINAGVRYSYFQQPTDAHKMLTTFDPLIYDSSKAPTIDSTGHICKTAPCAGGAAPNAGYDPTNGIVVAGTSGAPFGDHPAPQMNKAFAPRVGFAYDLFGNGKTAIRGGYGIAFDSSLVGDIEQNIFQNPPYVQNISINAGSLSNPLSGTVNVSTVPPALHATQYQSALPYGQQFSLDLQHQWAPDLISDIGYVGSLGTHLLGEVDLNQPRPGAWQSLGVPSITRSNTTLLNRIRPWQGYDAINAIEPWFSSNYHSLQAAVQKRFKDGSLIDANYTWSKALTNNQTDRSTAVQNLYNIAGEYGPAQYDIRHMFNADFVYALPFYRTQQGVIGHVLGGWQLGGLVYMNGGVPLTVTTSADPAGLGLLDSASAAGARPNQTGNPNSGSGIHTRTNWFNKSVFVADTNPNLPGNEHRGSVRGPGWQRWDLALYKNINIGERVKFQFRGETFNTFNHTNYSGVTVSNTSSLFGYVTSYRDPRIIQLGGKLNF
ncbi:MAG TPA: TonB-dependent receptor [Acidobacteriaceae bacterium]|nr:TonB-dependent receptor [Acidobacteriaceae bacterium]